MTHTHTHTVFHRDFPILQLKITQQSGHHGETRGIYQ